MADKKTRHVIADLRGGRNTYDAPWAIADTQCVDAVNVDYYKSRLGRKRDGMTVPAWTNVTRTGITSSVARHVPSSDETLSETWVVDDAATPIIERLTAGLAFTAPTLKDAPTGNGWDFTFASINGKLMIAYKSAVDRLHCWDPVSASVRRTGLAATIAPTAANTGGGTYAAVLRYYRERSTVQVAGVTIRRSEPSPSVSITPSGAGTGVIVTQAAVINEGETHWEVEGSTDNITFYRLATVVIGTTTYTDSALTTTYGANPLSALTGVYTLQKSYKFIAADQNRLLGFGAWVTTNKQARVELSAVIGSLDISDEERVDTSAVNSYLDLDENDSGAAIGLAGPVFGAFFVFKGRQVWQLTPTGVTSGPYRQEKISATVGAVAHYAITRGDDARGNAALYWVSHRGVYRWSVNGLEYIGRGIEDFFLGDSTTTINLAATHVVARAVYYGDRRQVWCWVAIGSSNDPNNLFFYDVQTGGWSRVPSTDLLANVRCAAMLGTTLTAPVSINLVPYVGQTGGTLRLWKAAGAAVDNATTYQAYVTTKAVEPGGPGFRGEVGNVSLLAAAGMNTSGVALTVTVTGDFGLQTKTSTAPTIASPVGAETRVAQQVEGTDLSGVAFVQYQIGDATATASAWTLDRLVIPVGKADAVGA